MRVFNLCLTISVMSAAPIPDLQGANSGQSRGKNPMEAHEDVLSIGFNKISKYTMASPCISPLSRVVRLHIPMGFFTNLAAKAEVCPLNDGNKPTCLGSAPAGANRRDDDQKTPEAPLPRANLNNSKDNYTTPIDMDLSPSSGSLWNDNHDPILIKIILDDPTWQFITPVSDHKDWSYAVLQGREGSGMFTCLRGAEIDNPNHKVNAVTFRASFWQKTTHNFGGLNIGILVPTLIDGKTGVLPVYVDPMIHNNG